MPEHKMEIALPSTNDETFVCVLSSVNLEKYDEWKDTDLVKIMTYFLDTVAEETVQKLERLRDSNNPEDNQDFYFLKRAYNFVKRHRALGLGVLGWSSYLQRNMIPFESQKAFEMNKVIHKQMQDQSHEASRELADLFGEPEVLEGYGRRNTTTCVTGDTKILTSEGQKEISSIVDKEVSIWNGSNWSTVSPYKTGVKNIYKVKLSNGVSIKCTDDHKFMVLTAARDGYGQFANKYQEVTTLNLRRGDCMPKFGVEATGTDADLEYAYTSGFFCGDGSVNCSREGKYPRNEIRLYGDKEKLVDKIDWKSKNTWGTDCIRGYVPDDILEKHVVPHEYSIKSKTEWLCGLIDADGSSSSVGVSISMKDYSFALDVSLLVQSLGGEVSITEATRNGGYSSENSVYYVVNISLFSCGKIFHNIKPHRVNVYAEYPKTAYGKQKYTEVVEVVDMGYSEQTYCFTEEIMGQGVFNGILTKQCAIAPTTSSAAILGQVSQSIEPWMSNNFVKTLAKMKVEIRNRYLEELLESYGRNDEDTWESIAKNDGSVSHLGFLTENEREVFKTFREIDQYAIVNQAADRQEFLDQTQSLNLMVDSKMSPKELNQLTLHAWKKGICTLYYQHSVSAAQQTFQQDSNCESCEA